MTAFKFTVYNPLYQVIHFYSLVFTLFNPVGLPAETDHPAFRNINADS
jgi:hypothetical protein